MLFSQVYVFLLIHPKYFLSEAKVFLVPNTKTPLETTAIISNLKANFLFNLIGSASCRLKSQEVENIFWCYMRRHRPTQTISPVAPREGYKKEKFVIFFAATKYTKKLSGSLKRL